jgi:hypothetical protein
MRVEKQSNPWPWVLLVSGLLFCCLLVPRFWRSQAIQGERELDFAPEATAEFPVAGSDIGFAPPTNQFAGGDLLNLGACSIEDAVAAHTGKNGSYGTPTNTEWITLPLATRPVSPQTLAPPSEDVLAATDPIVMAALEGVGQGLARFSTANLLPRIASEAAEQYWTWVEAVQADRARLTQLPLASGKSTLRFHTPSIAESFSSQPGESFSDCWCVPRVLFDQLERLAAQPESADWARRTIDQLRVVTTRDGLEGADAQVALASLSELALDAVRMADATSDDALRVELLRAHWALARRLDRWSVMHEIHVASRSQNRIALRGSMTTVFKSTAGGSIVNAPSTDETTLSNDLEAYEKSRNPQLGRQIAQNHQALVSSPDTLDRALGEAVEQHYRNANIRVAVTATMLNRLMGDDRSEVTSINDRIAGARVHGTAHTEAQSRVRLQPAEGQWQIEVQSQGVVDSNTLVNGGPVRFRNQGTTNFTARKSVVVDAEGVFMQPSNVDATNFNRLVGVTTDYDWAPLLGSFTRDRALSQYRAKQHRAKIETELRVADQASDYMDQETRKAVENIRNQVRERLTDRLDQHGIDLTPVELTTTEERVVARLRVAGENQLGSHTPRPRALSDSLASVQVHESALTNLAVTLDLGGKTYKAPELQQHLRRQFPYQVEQNPVEARPDVTFHFAQDAVQVHIAGGRLELTMALENMQHGGRSMRDILVHAYYVPVVSGMSAELARDGSLGIEGRLTSADRARLHNIFNSVLPPERHLPLVQLDDPADPRFKDLMVTQLVLEDGWFGLAIGPAAGDRVAERSRSMR